MTHSEGRLKRCVRIVPAAYPRRANQFSSAGMPASNILTWPSYIAVGDGDAGPCGPRTGNSSGIWPGNSSGLGGSPGSCIGGGTSGRGLPGGLSCGGSAGFPGLIGGSSCGSIGISHFPELVFRIQRHRYSNVPRQLRLKCAPAACCCGSWRSRHSRARACLRCNRPAIRCATDVRLPRCAATAMMAPL